MSQVELAGGAVADQASALDVAAHRPKIAMAGVAHNVFVAHAFVLGFGDETDAQGMRAEPVKPVHRQPGHLHAMGQNPADGVGMQRDVADAIPGAHFSKQRPGFSSRHPLPSLERAHRTDFHMPPARQADLSPCPA
jgi:hypothetical protein